MPSENRRGFSLAEILMCLVLVALITKLSLPKIVSMREKNAVRAAKLQLASQIATARNAAIRRSQKSTFAWQSGEALAKVGPTGTETVVGSRVRFTSMRVTVTPQENIEFDARGFATNLTARKVYRFTRNGVTDSMCVSRVGQISRYCQ
jgi:prepilin-type N-terminal cleavage/methylation domain-containing protein